MKNLTLCFISTLFILSACNQSQTTSNSSSLPENLKGDGTVVAKIGGKNVYKSEFASYTKLITKQDLDTLNGEIQKQLFSDFLQLESLSRKALADGIADDPEFGLQLLSVKKNLLAQGILKRFEVDNVIPEDLLKAEYENTKSDFQILKIKASHILVKTREEAAAIIKQLDQGTSFEKLSSEKSIDTAAAQNGGSLGWFSPKDMVPTFAQAAVEMGSNTYSKEPVQTQFGFHVIKKDEQKVEEAPPFENLRPRLEQTIKQRMLEKYLEDIESEFGIEDLFTNSLIIKTPVVEPSAADELR